MAFNFTNFDKGLKEATDWLVRENSHIHTGRANPAFLDSVQVEAYGSMQPLKNIGSIGIEDAKSLRISIWDKNTIKDAEKAVLAANLGLSVVPDGEGMRIIFPALTTETREKLVKILKEKMEEARKRVRQERESVLGEIKGAELPEDDEHRAKEEVQKKVDGANKELEKIFESKETEVMS